MQPILIIQSKTMSSYILPGIPRTDPDHIIRTISNSKHIPVSDLLIKDQHKELVYCRHLIFWFLYNYANMKHWKIAFMFKLHRCTIMHGIRRINNEMYMGSVCKDIETLKSKLWIKC